MLVEQFLRVDEITSIETFGEPGVDGGEDIVSLLKRALPGPQGGKISGCVQFGELHRLLACDLKGLGEASLRRGCLRRPLPQQQVASCPMQFGQLESRAGLTRDSQRPVHQGEALNRLTIPPSASARTHRKYGIPISAPVALMAISPSRIAAMPSVSCP